VNVQVLHGFIAVNRLEIISRCRAKAAVRSMPLPASREIDDSVPSSSIN